MKRAPTMAAINAAELRLLQSKLNVRQSVEGTRSALRTAIKRPSTLALVALGSGITAYWITRKLGRSVESVPDNAGSAAKASHGGFVRNLISLYGAQILPFVLQYGAAAMKQRVSGVNSNMPTSATGNNATTEHGGPG